MVTLHDLHNLDCLSAYVERENNCGKYIYEEGSHLQCEP